MTRYFCVLAACAACNGPSDVPDIGAWFTRAEIHVDAANPTALAIPDLELALSGGEEGRYVRIERVTLIPTDAPRIRIGLTLDEEPLYVPAYTHLQEPLINEDLRNEQLVSYCQSTVPILLELSFPGHRDLLAHVWEQDLVVFCP